MSTTPEELDIERHGAEGLHARKPELMSVYHEVYADRLDDPFFAPDRFWKRLEAYAKRDGFRLTTGRVDRDLVGFTLGGVLPPNTAWWRGLKSDVTPEFLHETGNRTFGINEIQVRQAHRRRGYATAMTDAMLDGLPVERVTLLVQASNTPAYTAYTSWGFHNIGQLQPFADSPLYEAMVRQL